MPENAVASGFVDFVLSPEKIGIELARIARHPGLQQRLAPKSAESTGTEESVALKPGCSVCSASASVWILRITRNPRCKGALRTGWSCAALTTRWQYLRLLEKEAPEVDALFRDALIHVTSFFRDPAVFQTLRESGACRRLSNTSRSESRFAFGCPGARRAKKSIRWRFACWKSCLRTSNGRGFKSTRPTSAKRPSHVARAGVYPKSISREVSAARLTPLLLGVPGRLPGRQSATRGLHLCPAGRGKRPAVRADRPDQLPQPAHLFRCGIAKESAAHVALCAESRRLPGPRFVGGLKFFPTISSKRSTRSKRFSRRSTRSRSTSIIEASGALRCIRASRQTGRAASCESSRRPEVRRPGLASALESMRGDH